jgi:DNA-directed RNA polymerase specialized sigma24 family protein
VWDRYTVYGRVVASSTELRGFLRDAVTEVYRYALALTGSPPRAEQLTIDASVRLARHIDAVGAAPVSESRLALAVRREVLDTRPRRRQRDRRPEPSVAGDQPPPTTALGALDRLSPDERLAFVLRHHDGLLLPDVGAAISRSHAETEALLASARELVHPAAVRYDDGTASDPYARLLRAVPGPPDGFADRVWASVDRALVPDYAVASVPAVTDADRGLAWVGAVDGSAAQEDVDEAPGPRRTGVSLLAGGVVLGIVLGVAALTAPHRGQAGNSSSDVDAGSTTTPTPTSSPPSPTTTVAARPGRAGQAPAVPDLVVDVATVVPHPPDTQLGVLGAGSSSVLDGDAQTVFASVRNRNDVGRVVVRRSEPTGGSSVWLVEVQGNVRRAAIDGEAPYRAWGVDGGGVVMTLRVEGNPDALVLVGLRPGGGGTWLRLPDGARPLTARADGSVLCLVPTDAGPTVSVYRVLS